MIDINERAACRQETICRQAAFVLLGGFSEMFGTFVQKFWVASAALRKIRCEICVSVIGQSEVKIEAEEVGAEGLGLPVDNWHTVVLCFLLAKANRGRKE